MFNCKQILLASGLALVVAANPLLAQSIPTTGSSSEPTIVTTPPAADDDGLASQRRPLPGEILDEISVTATRRPARARDTTVNTYVLRKEDFRAVGATNLREALILIPGIFAR